MRICLTTVDYPMKTWNISIDIAYLLQRNPGPIYKFFVGNYTFKTQDNVRLVALFKDRSFYVQKIAAHIHEMSWWPS